MLCAISEQATKTRRSKSPTPGQSLGNVENNFCRRPPFKLHEDNPELCSKITWKRNGINPSIRVTFNTTLVVLNRRRGPCTKSHNNDLLCATSVFSVSLWL